MITQSLPADDRPQGHIFFPFFLERFGDSASLLGLLRRLGEGVPIPFDAAELSLTLRSKGVRLRGLLLVPGGIFCDVFISVQMPGVRKGAP